MNIQLTKLVLTNFKGIRSLTINFDHITNAFGDNATGKTTIFDAFTWLLFGKDSTDRKDFEIKTLDAQNRVLEKLDHEVTGTLLVDGEELVLKRVLKEKWTKKRGTDTAEFTGNETLYFWNEVPMQQKEYQQKISDLVDETVFKLITNTLYFNSIPWQQRRQQLVAIAGNISDAEIAAGDAEFEILLASLGKKTLAEFKKQIAQQKKLLKESLEIIPARIDEATRSMPDVLDFAGIEKQIAQQNNILAGIENELTDSVKALKAKHDQINALQTQIHSLQTTSRDKEFKLKSDFQLRRSNRETSIQDIKRLIRNAQDDKNRNNTDYLNYEKAVAELKRQQDVIRDRWNLENEKTFKFDEASCNCPTCGQKLPGENIEAKKAELEKNFNTNKIQLLDGLKKEGVAKGEQIKEYEAKMKERTDSNQTLTATIESHQQKLAQLEAEHNRAVANEETEYSRFLTNDAEIGELKLRVQNIEKEIEALNTPEQDNSQLKNERASLQIGIDELIKKLNNREQITRTKNRIAELEAEEKSLAQQIAELEGKEFTMDRFRKAQIDELESRINGMFKHVRFKMFKIQINGGEEECCETTYKGVPWSDLNNAARINCGLDIINTLCQFYKVTAPVFIDNAESVTRLIPVESQVVRLVVSEADKVLRVETETAEVAA